MNANPDAFSFDDRKPDGQNYFEALEFHSDEPGDTTVRPGRPALLEAIKQQRARLERLEQLLKEQTQGKPPTQPPDNSSSGQASS